MLLDTGQHYFFDRYGKLRSVSACSFSRYDNLLHLYHIFWKLVFETNEEQNLSFDVLIDKQPKILEVSKSILKLCAVKFKWVDRKLLSFLVYSYQDTDGNPHKGFLYEINFREEVQQKIEGYEEKSTTWEEYYLTVLAQLSLVEGSFEKAINLMENESKPVIEGALKQRAEIIQRQQQDPENKQAKIQKGKKKYFELMERREKDRKARELRGESLNSSQESAIKQFENGSLAEN